MKILQINASYKPAYIYGGPTMSVAKLSEQLVKAGCEVEVFTTTANGLRELPVVSDIKLNIDGVNVTYFKRLTKDHTHFSPRLLVKLWREAADFDVIHIHAWWNLVSVFSALIALKSKTPVIISPRGTLSAYSFSNKNSLIKKILHNVLGKRLLNNSFIHATSNAEQQALTALLKPLYIFNIPNLVNLAETKYEQIITGPEIFKLLFFSRIEEKKGLDILLGALPALRIPYHLTIAGDGDKDYIAQLKNITRDNLSSPYITWIGFLNENKFDVLHNHQLLVLPSYNENFGNVVIESLSVGTPVLISGQVGLAGYVLKNKFGWVCQLTPESVSSTIHHIAAQQMDEINRIRNSAPVVIQRDFKEEVLITKYIDMYRQIRDHDGV
ncbi:MAG: glycosyl transferase group 1 [Mucilaginibacter sp.]|nr:glycosyl transferase group 1 [Mucilaginibacter sp.]